MTTKPKKFSELAAGETGFVMLVGKPTEIVKSDWYSTGGQAYNARKATGRKGRTSITANVNVFETAEACQAWHDATIQNFIDYRRWCKACLVIPGVNAPINEMTNIAREIDEQLEQQRELDATYAQAGNRWGY